MILAAARDCGIEVGNKVINRSGAVNKHQKLTHRFVLHRYGAMQSIGDMQARLCLFACEQARLRSGLERCGHAVCREAQLILPRREHAEYESGESLDLLVEVLPER